MKSNPFALALAGIMAFVALGCSAPTSSPSSKPTGKEEPPHENVLFLRNENHELSVSVSSLPELQAYLQPLTPAEIEAEKERMLIDSFSLDSKTIYFVLKYGCGTKLCDTLLLKKTGDQIVSRFLYESVTFRDYQFSPDQKKLAMRLGRNEGTGVNRETLLVLHTDDLHTAEGKETTGNWQDHSIFNGEISLPILNYAWKDAFTLEVTFPKIDSASYEEIRKWMNTEGGQQQTLAVRYE